jgi:hypothetical protein
VKLGEELAGAAELLVDTGVATVERVEAAMTWQSAQGWTEATTRIAAEQRKNDEC